MLTLGHRFAASFAAGVLAVCLFAYSGTVIQASLSDDASGRMVLLFSPGTDDSAALAAIIEAGGLPVGRVAERSEIWTVVAPEAGFLSRAKALGVWLALREVPVFPLVAGCFATLSPTKLQLQDVALR